MSWIVTALAALAAALFALLLTSALLTGNGLAAVFAAIGLALALPWPGRALFAFAGGWQAPLRFLLGLAAFALFGWALIGGGASSIYKSPDIRARFHAMYAAAMADWPLPYEDVFIESGYGTHHVIVSGRADAPPMLLLHASGVASLSWRVNAEALGRHFRLYAIDTIGDVGLSDYANLAHVLETRGEQADLYANLMEELGIDTPAVVVGASEGGFIASNLAVHHPDRVSRLILLGPMGYAGATGAVIRITLAQLFPLKPVQDATFRWAFSDAPALMADFGPWFRLLMSGAAPVKVAPLPLPAEERRAIAAPTLFVFGTRDNLVGDPQAARTLVSDMQDVRVEVVEAGHLMGAEVPEQINRLILGFARANPR